MKTFRTEETEEKYRHYIHTHQESFSNGTFNLLDKEPLREWEYWVLVRNDFPYDRIASVHNMLVPKRVFGDSYDMTFEEFKELGQIQKEMGDAYDYIFEGLSKKRSIFAHMHFHLIKLKD